MACSRPTLRPSLPKRCEGDFVLSWWLPTLRAGALPSPRQRVAAACLWLATKLEENPRKLRDVINVFLRMECRREGLPLEVPDYLSKVRRSVIRKRCGNKRRSARLERDVAPARRPAVPAQAPGSQPAGGGGATTAAPEG